MQVERVDFVSFLTQDIQRAKRFYAETLGLPKNPLSTDTWVEFETGNVTLALVTPEQIGKDFVPLPFGTIAIRVPDIEAAKAKLAEAGVAFEGETWTQECATGRSSRTQTATVCSSTTATRRIRTGHSRE